MHAINISFRTKRKLNVVLHGITRVATVELTEKEKINVFNDTLLELYENLQNSFYRFKEADTFEEIARLSLGSRH